ncbi:MAG: lipopolysaccharide biosynthesis protein [Myxococcales bacterium]|nr:MAG: lipopolysaccharide biosynthesis protein [Myxococcales bacterium]
MTSRGEASSETDALADKEPGRAGVRLVKQSMLYTLGIAATRFANLLLLPFYLRTLSKEDYGALGVLEQLVQMMVIITMAGGMETLVKIGSDLYEKPEDQLRLVSTMTTWMLLSGAVVGVLGSLLWPWAGQLLGGIRLWPLGVCALFTVAASSAFQSLSAHLQVRGEVRKHTLFQALRTAVNVAIGVPLLLLTDWGLMALLLATCLSYWICAGALATQMPKGLRLSIDPALLKRVLRYGVPLLPHIAAAYIFQSLDKFMLAGSSEHGLEVAGVYSVGSRIASGAMMLGLGMQRAWLPFFFKQAKQGDAQSWERVRHLSFWSMAGMATCVAGLSLTAPEVVALITPGGYGTAAAVTSVLCLGTLYRTGAQTAGAVVLSNESAAYRIWLASLPAALVNIALNIWWIPRWGALGACWATSVAMALNMLFTVMMGRAVRKVPFRYGAIGALLLTVTLIVALAEHAPLLVRLALCAVVPLLAVAFDWSFARAEVGKLLARRRALS